MGMKQVKSLRFLKEQVAQEHSFIQLASIGHLTTCTSMITALL